MEQFQPVLKFLEGLKNEAIMGFRTLDLNLSPEAAKTAVVGFKTQANLASLILELPKVLDEVTVQAQHREKKLEQMRQANLADFSKKKGD